VVLAHENPLWGCRGLHGELTRPGVNVAASTVCGILRGAGRPGPGGGGRPAGGGGYPRHRTKPAVRRLLPRSASHIWPAISANEAAAVAKRLTRHLTRGRGIVCFAAGTSALDAGAVDAGIETLRRAAEEAEQAGDWDEARDVAEQAFALARQLGDPRWEGMAGRAMALVAEQAGDQAGARDWVADARPICRSSSPGRWYTGPRAGIRPAGRWQRHSPPRSRTRRSGRGRPP
jgi:hypothetical protein